ncbi:MAG: Bacterial leucyl aminopeptidase precursor [Lentisphaerae bacterium ADurb.BinA184]|nr:MAG: Bacterial leucyl aminopeptidase precursor [Lentisphaerae bacterium ADurb.BinA184]
MRVFLAATVLFAGLVVHVSADIIQDVVNQVSEAQYTAYLTADDFLYTQAGNNRNNGTAQFNAAVANVLDTFLSFGLAATIENTPTYQNVVAPKNGSLRPDDIYIVGAHLDSVGNPGADDDASGVAGVLECARVLSRYPTAASLVFITFDQEEDGLLGSTAYAQAARARGDNILGMLSLDMIAYNHPDGTPSADIYGRTASDAVKNAVAAALLSYGGLPATISGDYPYSDHAPFEAQGYPACLLIEDWGNPYYHQAADNTDVPGYLDYAYGTDMVRGAVGYLATAAVVLVPEPGTWLPLLIVALGALRRPSPATGA